MCSSLQHTYKFNSTADQPKTHLSSQITRYTRSRQTSSIRFIPDSVAECTAGRGKRRGADLDGACVCVESNLII